MMILMMRNKAATTFLTVWKPMAFCSQAVMNIMYIWISQSNITADDQVHQSMKVGYADPNGEAIEKGKEMY
jgi:hypothetical protein